MSGQHPMPNHQTGETPGTMDGHSSWNHPVPKHSQGSGVVSTHNLSPGAPQNVAHGILSQPHVPTIGQVSGAPTGVIKLPNVPHNGAGGHMLANLNKPNPQKSLSENLRHNLNMYMSQNSMQASKCGKSNFSSTLSSVQSESIALLQGGTRVQSPPQVQPGGQNEPIALVAPPIDKDLGSSRHNTSKVSAVEVSTVFNGDVNSRTSSSSVSPNVLIPPNTKVSNISDKNIVVKGQLLEVKAVNDSKVRLSESASFALKRELLLKDVSDVGSDRTPLQCTSSLYEPPLKRVKEEEGGNSATLVSSRPSTDKASIQHQPCNKDGNPNQPSYVEPSLPARQDASDVESQLEALFAGITDDGNSGKESKVPESSNSLQGTPNVADILESKGSTVKKGKGKANGVSKSNDPFGTSSTESTPKKKAKKKPAKDKPWEDAKNRKSKKSGAPKGKFLKEASCDSGSNASFSRLRGPVVHIEGPKDAPTSLAVINAPSRQDDEENESKRKGQLSSRNRKSHSSEGKLSSSGLCGNSLVSRYEAHSSDPRWVCVFCKRGCHVQGLGDLFGPYLVHHDPELERSLENGCDADRKSVDKKDKKSKRSGMGQTGVLGLLAIPPLAGEQPQFMVWFHESCAVWSPTVNLIGSRLAGLQEAVWVAVHSKCSRCQGDGANIGCVHHGCFRQMHYPCAQDENWSLNDDTFISTCHVHKMLGQSSIIPKEVVLKQ